ncbi:unnamed protein product, partial [marine sediment metagenome]
QDEYVEIDMSASPVVVPRDVYVVIGFNNGAAANTTVPVVNSKGYPGWPMVMNPIDEPAAYNLQAAVNSTYPTTLSVESSALKTQPHVGVRWRPPANSLGVVTGAVATITITDSDGIAGAPGTRAGTARSSSRNGDGITFENCVTDSGGLLTSIDIVSGGSGYTVGETIDLDVTGVAETSPITLTVATLV